MQYAALSEVTEAQGWRQLAEAVVCGSDLPTSLKDAFGSYWIVAGHHIREQVADDRLLCQMLRLTTPPYNGGRLTLYRGENLDRWNTSALGLSWTRKIEVARMFGRGLNSVGSGGVLLAGKFSPGAIAKQQVMPNWGPLRMAD
jgi:hypothetical protein